MKLILQKTIIPALFLLSVLFSQFSFGQCTFGNYPPTYTAAANFGQNYLLGTKYTLSSSSTLTALGYKGNGTGSGMQMAIYSDVGGVVGNLVAVTNLTTNATGNIILPLTTPTVIPPGDYWIMAVYQLNALNQVCYTTSSLKTVSYISLTYGSPPPNTASWLTYSGQDFNYWAVIAGTPPTVRISTSNTVICAGNPVSLVANGASIYNWSTGATSTTITPTPTINTTYSVVGTNSLGCFNSAVQSISVNPLPPVTASTSSAVCAGSNGCLFGGGATTYTWVGPCAFVSTQQNPCFSFNIFCGCNYTLTGTDANGCKNSATVCISVNPNPTVTATTSNSLICVGQTSTLTANGALTYSWSTSSTNSTSVISPTATTNYSVMGTNSFGCTNSVSITQSVSPCTNVSSLSSQQNTIQIFPNPFSDKINIEMYIPLDLSFQIFNSLGAVIYSGRMEKGKAEIDLSSQPSGIYFIKAGSLTKKIIKQ